MARWSRRFFIHASFVPSVLSGDVFDSQFCEMKKVNAPDGVRLVRVSTSSSSPTGLVLLNVSIFCSFDSAIT